MGKLCVIRNQGLWENVCDKELRVVGKLCDKESRAVGKLCVIKES